MKAVGLFLRSCIFYPLYFLRGIFFVAAKLMSGLLALSAVVAAVFAMFSDGSVDGVTSMGSWKLPAFFMVLGALLAALMTFYDRILLALNPTGTELILYS